MEKHYLQLEFGTGRFFQYSKKEKEGYERHESKTGNISYRKYFNEVTGTLESVSLRDGKFGKELSTTLKDGQHIYYLPIGLSDQRGNVSTFAEEMIKFLPNMDKGTRYTIRGYNFVPEGEEYSRIGISVKFDTGEKLGRALSNAYYNKKGELVEGDIPAVEWKKNALGKNKPSAASLEQKDEYLLEVVVAQTERLAWKKDETSQSEAKKESKPPSKKTTKKPIKKEEVVGDEDDEDDLPF